MEDDPPLSSCSQSSPSCSHSSFPPNPIQLPPLSNRLYHYDGNKNLTLHDYSIHNCLLYSQGDWSLIHRDLQLAQFSASSLLELTRPTRSSSSSSSSCVEILLRAFQLRKELIQYKKICLHLFQEGQRLERSLKQTYSFFYWWDGDNVQEGIRTHFQALMEDMKGWCPNRLDVPNPNRNTLQNIYNTTKDKIYVLYPTTNSTLYESIQRHGVVLPDFHHTTIHPQHEVPSSSSTTTSSCTLLDRKRLFVTASGLVMFQKGVQYAIQDARDVIKAICMSPRYMDWNQEFMTLLDTREEDPHNSPLQKQEEPIAPKGEEKEKAQIQRPKKLKDLPNSMLIYHLLPNPHGIQKEEENSFLLREKNHTVVAQSEAFIQRLLQRVQVELGWTSDAIQFLQLSIHARGGCKAITMMEELCHYSKHLRHVICSLEMELNRLIHEQEQIQHSIPKDITESDVSLYQPTEQDLSLAVQRHRQICLLSGALCVSRENVKWIHVLVQSYQQIRGDDNPTLDPSTNYTQQHSNQRLFMANDHVRSLQCCAFVPKDFQLGNVLQKTRHIYESILQPTMRAILEIESWPPREGSRRTRVLAYDSTTVTNARIQRKKLQTCTFCNGFFDSRWIHLNICSVCEWKQREIQQRQARSHNNLKCFFGRCKVHAFCTHANRCFICDAPHSCEQHCRLSRGDGEWAAMLVEHLKPRYLFLDFDRTLSSTKLGASPITMDRTCQHTIDPELKSIVITQQQYGESAVITRNTHKAEIEAFLAIHELYVLSKNVHVVPKKQSKGSYIKNMFFVEASTDQTNSVCLMIDDDIRELVSCPFLTEDPRVHRLLFVRCLS